MHQAPFLSPPAGTHRAPGRRGRTLASGCRLAALAAAALVLVPAQGASVRVRDADGSQWRALEDPADEAQGYVLERLRPDGRLDARFGHEGLRPLAISATNDAPTSVRVDAKYRIWVAGASIAGDQPQAVVERYLPDGALDLQWGIQGKVQLSPGGLAIKPNDLLPLTDGSVLVAGVAANVEPSRAVVFHLLANGALDLAFGQGGTWQRTGASEGSTATSLAASDTGAVAVAVAARGDKAAAEAWSLNDTPPRLVLQQALEESSDGEDVRVNWSGSRFLLGRGDGPTLPGVAAMLHAPASVAPAPASLAASAPHDPGQGAFSPFAAEPASDVPVVRDQPEGDLPWARLAASVVACCVVLGLLVARGKKPAEVIRAGKGR